MNSWRYLAGVVAVVALLPGACEPPPKRPQHPARITLPRAGVSYDCVDLRWVALGWSMDVRRCTMADGSFVDVPKTESVVVTPPRAYGR